MSQPLLDPQARIEALEAENRRLRAEIEDLKLSKEEQDEPLDVLPPQLRLTPKETAFLFALSSGRAMTKNAIMSAIYRCGIDDQPEMKIIGVFACRVRKKIAPYGMSITTIWGLGYQLPKDSVIILRSLYADQNF
jgi:two-component system cell cycle response regulator CtrA